jgi:hypothetical protein
MSKRHQASRRRSYGRRQHEVRERRELAWAPGVPGRELDDGLAPVDHGPEGRLPTYGAAWVGLD